MLQSSARIGAILLIVPWLGSCATREVPQVDFTNSVDFARAQMAAGHHDVARSALLNVRHQAVEPAEKAEHALLLADCHLAQREYEAAVGAYYSCRSANVARDRTISYRTALGLGLAQQGLRRWRLAERHLREALTVAQDRTQRDRVNLRLAEVAQARGDRSGARSYLAQIEDRTVFGYAQLERGLTEARVPTRSAPRAAPLDRLERAALPRVLTPPILNRARWGAKPLRTSGAPEPMEAPYRVTVHHGGETAFPPTSEADSISRLRSYQVGHFERGWADIGYHYVIDGSGRIWEGREMRWQGAHAGNPELNRGNIGVCLMGQFQNREPTAAQKESLRQVLIWLSETYGIAANNIAGHRAVLREDPDRGTLCPGRRLEAYLNELRRDIGDPRRAVSRGL